MSKNLHYTLFTFFANRTESMLGSKVIIIYIIMCPVVYAHFTLGRRSLVVNSNHLHKSYEVRPASSPYRRDIGTLQYFVRRVANRRYLVEASSSSSPKNKLRKTIKAGKLLGKTSRNLRIINLLQLLQKLSEM